MNSQQNLIVPESDAGRRLDVWITEQLRDLSRSRIQALIHSGNITIGDKTTKESRKTTAGDRIKIIFPEVKPVKLASEAITLNVLYQDSDLIIINKPAGLVTHPTAGKRSGTLVNALLHHCPDLSGIGWELRPGIVHRLDKDTSGVMVAAKNDIALTNLLNQFKNRQVHKKYLAIIHGKIQPATGTINATIGRNKQNRTKMKANADKGRAAITNYKIIKAVKDFSFVEAEPKTGRTHQIRVHFAYAGHPIAGDRKYGTEFTNGIEIPRQMLHARLLCFRHPTTQKEMSFTAAIPDDMTEVLNQTGISISQNFSYEPDPKNENL